MWFTFTDDTFLEHLFPLLLSNPLQNQSLRLTISCYITFATMDSNIFRSKGYSFVTNPSEDIKPLQLIVKKSPNEGINVNAQLSDLFVEKTYPIPIIQKNKRLASCLNPLDDWTKIENQFSHSKFRNHGKTKTTIQSGREAQYSSGG
jgi:hypothetical protein